MVKIEFTGEKSLPAGLQQVIYLIDALHFHLTIGESVPKSQTFRSDDAFSAASFGSFFLSQSGKQVINIVQKLAVLQHHGSIHTT
jgi:hypothetical protein